MTIKKKSLSFTLLALIVAVVIITFIPRSLSGNEIAVKAAEQLEHKGFEHIKRTSDKVSSEHYRDLNGSGEVSISYHADGSLFNKTIITEHGRRVYAIGNDNGTLEALTWELPNNIANENKEVLKKSLLQELKNELQNKDWIDEGQFSIDNKEVRKISSQEGKFLECVYIDQVTEMPIKKEFIEIVYGKSIVKATEEYRVLNKTPEHVFDVTGISAKEITAPVPPESTSKG
ncbi:hypothetical protein NQ117_15370 [Paenibacillus sp. SC116]|uniref:hypothetical protein n=1 Tax=Paenibacillus sp. SC116 TaxID=2968986 RepID=UPI00215B4A4F|nr:hypothetical protein [Paenibacillus sp. SC116]MCR8845062.1 hypothetical protein [Paenibacillus sp. SC116]